MQRGMISFPFPTGRNPVAKSAGQTTREGSGAMKASIIVFDTTPGTKTFTVPANVFRIRAFVVGAGGYKGSAPNVTGGSGGYSEKVLNVLPGQQFSYTVGAGGTSGTPLGGTSSFGGIISATGGAGLNVSPNAGGVGSGGDVNTTGGTGTTAVGGGSSGHRFGDGRNDQQACGNGWAGAASSSAGGSGGVDGFGLGIIPGIGGASGIPGGYGAGGGANASGGLGGGAGVGGGSATPGTGAISASPTVGGHGGVGVEVLEA